MRGQVATEGAHIRLANRNLAAMEHLCSDHESYCEWITTTAFYRALQVVEAVFAAQGMHGTSHRRRADLLKKDRRFSHIWRHYRPLQSASTIARYLHDTETNGSYSSFADYMSPEDVIPDLVSHRLNQVEKSAAKFLSERACQTLGLGK